MSRFWSCFERLKFSSDWHIYLAVFLLFFCLNINMSRSILKLLNFIMHRGPQFPTPHVFFMKKLTSSKQAFLVCQGLAPPPQYKFNSNAYIMYIGKLYFNYDFWGIAVCWMGYWDISSFGRKGGKEIESILKIH